VITLVGTVVFLNVLILSRTVSFWTSTGTTQTSLHTRAPQRFVS